MIQMLRKEACSGSIADLSHIRTQWCLADCLTKKSANPQNLIDAVRQGVLKEVDAHPPFRSLLEHKASLRSWLPTVCSHVDFRHDVFLLGDTLRDSWLFFEFVPAAQEVIESRRSHCFFTMSSSNRCDRTSAAEDQATASSSNQRQEFRDSQYDDEERRRSPSGEGFRYETEWFHADERVRKKRTRGMHALMGPNNMSGFDRHQMCMDVISWILEGDSKKRE